MESKPLARSVGALEEAALGARTIGGPQSALSLWGPLEPVGKKVAIDRQPSITGVLEYSNELAGLRLLMPMARLMRGSIGEQLAADNN